MKLINSASLLAITTAFLYCASTAFTHGYMGYFGLDPDILERNFHRTIYDGMIKSIELKHLLWLPLGYVLYSTVNSSFKILLARYLREEFENGRKVRDFKEAVWLPTKKPPLLERLHSSKIQKQWTIVLLVILFFVSMMMLARNGKLHAETIANNILEGEYTALKPKKSNELYFLYCGSKNCAGLNPKTKEVVYFPQSGHSQSSKLLKKTFANLTHSDDSPDALASIDQ